MSDKVKTGVLRRLLGPGARREPHRSTMGGLFVSAAARVQVHSAATSQPKPHSRTQSPAQHTAQQVGARGGCACACAARPSSAAALQHTPPPLLLLSRRHTAARRRSPLRRGRSQHPAPPPALQTHTPFCTSTPTCPAHLVVEAAAAGHIRHELVVGLAAFGKVQLAHHPH